MQTEFGNINFQFATMEELRNFISFPVTIDTYTLHFPSASFIKKFLLSLVLFVASIIPT